MNKEEFDREVEQYARYLCKKAGKDPDGYWEGFDRTAAWNDLCDEEVFPKYYYWADYLNEAWDAVVYFKGLNTNE